MELDFIVDKITESIELAATGERFETDVVRVYKASELKGVSKKNKWKFDWRYELRQPGRSVYKLVTKNEPDVIQGLVSFEIWEKEKFVFMPAIENAPFNIGTERKLYDGVCPNLVAYGCKLSKDYGFDGLLSFDSKPKLVEHYKKRLRATHYCGKKMGMEPNDAEWLINNYFFNEMEGCDDFVSGV